MLTSFGDVSEPGINESAHTLFLLTSIVGVIATAGVPASLHRCQFAELRRRNTSQKRQEALLQKEVAQSSKKNSHIEDNQQYTFLSMQSLVK